MNSEERLLRELENMKEYKSFDVDQEWEQFLTIAGSSESSKNETDNVRRLPLRAIMAAAASVIILIGLFSLFKDKEDVSQPKVLVEEKITIPETEVQSSQPVVPKEVVKEPTYPVTSASVADQNAIVSTTIPTGLIVEDHEQYLSTVTKYELEMDDGTVIAFEPGSQAIVQKEFIGVSERSVRVLTGSAIFDVESNDRAPFKIYTENAGVTVLGTIFKVDSEANLTRVENIEGQVSFYALEELDIFKILNPGDIIEFDGKQFAQIQEGSPELIAEAVSSLEVKYMPAQTLHVPSNPSLVEMPELFERNLKHNYTMKGLLNLFNQLEKNKSIVDSKSVLKQKFTHEQTLFIPVDYLRTNRENVLPLLKYLENVIDIIYEEGDKCEDCYKIKTINYKSGYR